MIRPVPALPRAIRAAFAFSIALAAGAVSAQGYPVKPIRLLVPLAAGSTADIVSRYAGQELGKALGQSVVIENKPGAGTSHHLSGVLFGRVTDTKLVHVPYKGAPQGVQAVMSGEVAMGFFNTPTVIGQIKGGQVRPLGVTSLKRSPLLPDVPTLDEQGIKGYEVNTWFGFVAPAGTPPDVVAKLNTELNRIFAAQEARDKLGPQGFDLAPPMAPATFGKLIADDLGQWVPIVKASGASAN